MSEFKLPDSLKDVKEKDMKNSAKKIVVSAIEHKVQLKIHFDEKGSFVYFNWGNDEYDIETISGLSFNVTLEFHKKQTDEIIKKIKQYPTLDIQ